MTDIWHTCEKCKARIVSSIEISRNGIYICCEKCDACYSMRFEPI